MMKYNIAYKRYLEMTTEYILLIDEKSLEKFVKDYNNGENTFFENGNSHTLGQMELIRIFDISKCPTLTMLGLNVVLTEAIGGARIVHIGHFLNIFIIYGCDVTGDFLKDSWGKGFTKSIEVIKDPYINISRIEELTKVRNKDFELTKLIKLCEEINSSNESESYYAVGALVRAILDHVPPIFSCKDFNEVANNYKAEGDSKSFKESMLHIIRVKNIADSILHSQIRKSEVLPTETQVDCKRDMDKLLGEIVRLLK
jgi:hypothetical protein